MKDEKEFQDHVIAIFNRRGAHAVNMEPSRTNPGIPDTNWCLDGIEGNLELKYVYDEGAAPMVRPMQLVWFRERIKAGGYPMFAYYVSCTKYLDEVYVYRGDQFLKLANAKNASALTDIPHLRVVDPNELIDGLISEMASWNEEKEG